MIVELFRVVVLWMSLLAPGRDHSELAWAVASQAHDLEEASLVTAIAFRESGFKNDAVGDAGRSVCAMQILHGSLELAQDAQACVRRGILMLRHSKLLDPTHPVAAYARGSRWRSPEAQRISDDRVRLAKRLADAPR